MTAKQILLSTLSFLVLLTTSFFVFHELSQPVADYDAITWVYGLKVLKREDIISKLHKEKLNGKPILLVNPVRISNRLKHHPFIASAKVKRYLYPHRKIKIYIEETKFWANYNGRLLDRNAKTVVNLTRSLCASRTRALLSSTNTTLVNISARKALSDAELATLLKLCNLIETSTKLKVKEITGDQEGNYTIHTNFYKFKVGLLDSKVLKRTQRVTLVLDQLRSIDKNKTDLDYIDLSLSSSEVILGKHMAAIPAKIVAAIKPKADEAKNKAAKPAAKVKVMEPAPAPKPQPKPNPQTSTQ